jgi:hypothetical protein
MKSPKNKTQVHRTKIKNFSALIALALAVVTLLQAGAVKSENRVKEMSTLEASLIAEVDLWFAEEAMDLEDSFLIEAEEAQTESVKVFDVEGNLLEEGDPSSNAKLRKLMNQAEFMSALGDQQYYALTK